MTLSCTTGFLQHVLYKWHCTMVSIQRYLQHRLYKKVSIMWHLRVGLFQKVPVLWFLRTASAGSLHSCLFNLISTTRSLQQHHILVSSVSENSPLKNGSREQGFYIETNTTWFLLRDAYNTFSTVRFLLWKVTVTRFHKRVSHNLAKCPHSPWRV